MFKFFRRWIAKLLSRQPWPKVIIATRVIDESVGLLQGAGDERSAHEKVLYWAGKSFDDRWVLTSCIAPKATTTWGSYSTSASENAKVIKFLAESELELLCQVHSHPGDLVGHSTGDDEGAFMPFENFVSIVVPNYGQRGILPLTQCGVHRFNNGKFVRLSDKEVEASFSVIDDVSNLIKND